MRRGIAAAAAALCLLAAGTVVQASTLRFCDRPADLSAAEQDRILRFGAIVKTHLEQSGHRLALVSRSGLDLGRFGVRYTHAGVSLQASREAPWAVRQLYYACAEQRPRIFDQGMAGFLLGLDNPRQGFISAVLLPPEAEAELERVVLDDRQALQLLGAGYSANAHAFSVSYQNCNQWLAEMLAAAWNSDASDGREPRAAAQAWLGSAGYRPTTFEVTLPPPRWLGSIFPLLHHDDHPADDLDRNLMRVSMPASIEDFVRRRLPQASRVEFCFDADQVVIHHGWQPLGEGCRPGPGDSVVNLAAQ
ncbi:DUF2145 domain-containing protein [Piscinibacter sakaiensis]|uniref:DUF2145 domain-containing protein n=1 Tax=Piscinibacter sakaiensis TaxID=1547922 RepID=UPI003AAF9BBD